MNLAEKAARKLVAATLLLEDGQSDGWRPFALTLEIQSGWHLYAPSDRNPSELESVKVNGVDTELSDLVWPDSTSWTAGGETLDVYEGKVVVRGRLRGGNPTLRVHFQPCDESRCLAPVSIELTE